MAPTQTPPVPTQTASPEEPTLAAMLYGSEADPVADTPEVQTPAETAETDSSLEVEKPEVSPEPDASQTTEEPATGTEALEAAKKQLADQTKANLRLGREMAELRENQRKLAEDNQILLAKLRGEYEEPAKPTPEQAAEKARIAERDRLSQAVAVGLFGQDVMNKRVFDDGSDLEVLINDEAKTNPGKVSPTKLAILLDEQPAVKAMRILQTRDFSAKWGDDPTQWEEKVVLAAKPKILAELKKSLAATNTGSQPRSVSEGRAAGGGHVPEREKSTAQILFPKS